MFREKMIKTIKEYYDDEIKDFATIDKYCKQYKSDKETHRKATIQRGLGVAFFVQKLGLDYEIVNEYYNNFKDTIDKM